MRTLQVRLPGQLDARAFCAEAFDEPPTPWVLNRINAMGMQYRIGSNARRDASIIAIIEALDGDLSVSGPHRLGDWERGWSENLGLVGQTDGALIPRYFGKHKTVRWGGGLVEAVSSLLDYQMLAAIQYWAFDKWLRDAKRVCEFGCGTGHNLVRLREVLGPKVVLVGADWSEASCRLVNSLGIGTWRFDMFQPHDVSLDGAAVFTCAAMEQLGDNFRPFADFLIAQRPTIALHIEPLVEMLDPTKLLDYLSIRYAEKRGYLRGFLPYMREREAAGDVEILYARDSGVGSLFLQGYQILVWRPK